MRNNEVNTPTWLFTFRIPPVDRITIEESHPDFNLISKKQSAELIEANLLGGCDLESMRASLTLPSSRLERVFRRVEHNMTRQEKRVIPAFEYTILSSNQKMFCFVFGTRTVLTPDSRFYLEEWPND